MTTCRVFQWLNLSAAALNAGCVIAGNTFDPRGQFSIAALCLVVALVLVFIERHGS